MKVQSLYYYSLAGDPGMPNILDPAGYTHANSAELAHIIIFNGGEDIGTELYDEEPVIPRVPKLMSGRDRYERTIFDKYKSTDGVNGKFFLGICRGAQFLNVMNGGSLWQHVDGHGKDHDMLDIESGQTIKCTSTHHPDDVPRTLDDGRTDCRGV